MKTNPGTEPQVEEVSRVNAQQERPMSCQHNGPMRANLQIPMKPVADPKTGEVQLLDIFIDGQWIGSRRTEEQCRQDVRNWEARNAR